MIYSFSILKFDFDFNEMIFLCLSKDRSLENFD